MPMNTLLRTTAIAALLGCVALAAAAALPTQETESPETMSLGNFSVSLTVKDIAASRAFYEKLGFTKVGGVQEQNWLVLQNGTTKIGIFQGMFERNMLTFNPGWDTNAKALESFEDVRDIQRRYEAAGLELTTRADPQSTGPASFTLVDPDGNPLLFDQHVPKAMD
jgi:catechol 2,3-dioxygenase-like lactoylglutathione lyase family enzyme